MSAEPADSPAGDGGRTLPQLATGRLDKLQRRLGTALFARIAGPEGPAQPGAFRRAWAALVRG